MRVNAYVREFEYKYELEVSLISSNFHQEYM